jgi:hypothetical protein
MQDGVEHDLISEWTAGRCSTRGMRQDSEHKQALTRISPSFVGVAHGGSVGAC